MATTTGTYDISTLLATRFQSVADFGLDTIQRVLEADIAAHNTIVNDMVGGMCEVTTDRQRRYGTSTSGEMVEVDEYGRSATQVARPGATVGFPLKMFQFAIGWTEKWFQNHTPADMAIAVQNAQKAHLRRVQTEIKKSIFLSANYTFTDFLVDNVDLSVKRFLNADSSSIPDGPNGETFTGSSHTHYLARAGGALASTDVKSAVDHVVEHGHGGMVKIAISRTDESTWRTLMGTGNLYPDPRMIYRATDTPGSTLDVTRIDNRAIGIYQGAEVWVKPWAIANYAFAWDEDGPKPLAFRQRNSSGLQGLRVASALSTYPLVAEYMEAEFGLGVWERTNGVVLYYGDTTYADPSIS